MLKDDPAMFNDDHLAIDLRLARTYGVSVAVLVSAVRTMISEVANQHSLYADDPALYPPPRKEMSADGFVPITNDELHDLTGLSHSVIMSSKKQAVLAGLLEVEKRGLPASHHYRIPK